MVDHPLRHGAGTMEVNDNTFGGKGGRVCLRGTDVEVTVAAEDMNGAQQGDVVAVAAGERPAATGGGPGGGGPGGRVTRILQRTHTRFLCQVGGGG
jgi:hypothetical protein